MMTVYMSTTLSDYNIMGCCHLRYCSILFNNQQWGYKKAIKFQTIAVSHINWGTNWPTIWTKYLIEVNSKITFRLNTLFYSLVLESKISISNLNNSTLVRKSFLEYSGPPRLLSPVGENIVKFSTEIIK